METTNKRMMKAAAVMASFALVFPCALRSVVAQSAAAQLTAARGSKPEPLMEEVYQNVQVLQGLPYGQMLPTMYLFAESLGVECEFCHAPSGMRHLDVKETKQTARRMIQMVFALNKNSFGDRGLVTCYTCHRGTPRPVGIPILASRERRSELGGPREVGGTNPGAMPTADQLLDKNITALGGAAAIQKISSRVEKGTVTELRSGRPSQHPVEIFAKAPDKRFTKGFSVQHIGNSPEAFGIYNGAVGWLREGSGPVVMMWSARLDAARLEDTLNFPLRARQFLSQLRVERTGEVGGREAYVVSGRFTQALPLVELYFEKDSGLLARLVYYTQTVVGLYPTQVEYADYRKVDGVQVPFRWTVVTIRDRQLTYQMDEVQQNLPMDESKFAIPTPLPSYR